MQVYVFYIGFKKVATIQNKPGIGTCFISKIYII